MLSYSQQPVIITGMIQPIPLPLNDANMLRIIRQLADNTSNIFILPHAKKRMKQRKITQTQVYACLRSGVIYEAAHPDIKGDWKCTLQHLHAGDEVRVAVVIECDETRKWIAVITVF